MKKFKRLFLQLVMASLMMGFSVEGGDPPAGDPPASDPPAGDPTPNSDPPAGDPPADPPAKTPEEIAADEQKTAAELESAKLVGAPEAYAPFTAPEGSKIPEGMEPALTTLGKKFNLSQEGTQSLLNHFSTEIEPLLQADREKTWQGVREGWKEQIKADPEIGGAKYEQTVKVATRAINTFMTDDIKQVLAEYGLGDHPGMVRLMYKIGTAMREDTFVPAAAGSTPESKLAGLYPTMNK